MAYSLQNLVVGETYNQLVHTGSPNLTGNYMYTANGTCIPYYITNNCFNFCADGQILGDFTVRNTLSGVAFGNCNSITNTSTSCLFGKNNTVVNGCSVYNVMGQGSYFTGHNIRSLNSFYNFVSSVRNVTSSITSLLGAHSSNYIATITSGGVGGYCNSLSGSNVANVGGNNIVLSSVSVCGSGFIGGRNNYIRTVNGTSCNTIIGGEYLSATDCNTAGATAIMTGRNMSLQTSYSIAGDTILIPDTRICEALIISGKNNRLIYPVTAASPTAFTSIGGCNNLYISRIVTCDPSTLLNGSNNIIHELSSISYKNTIYNGNDNRLSSITHASNIINGSCNILANTKPSQCRQDVYILNGVCNLLSGSCGQVSMIHNGISNITNIATGFNCGALIGSGISNYATSTIFTGISNRSYQQDTYIYTGICNTIFSNTQQGQQGGVNIFSGCGNIGVGILNSFIFSGKNNRMLTETSNLRIITGENNTLSANGNQTILGGCNNSILGPNGAIFIVGGRNNTAYCGSIAGSNLYGVNNCVLYVNNLVLTNLPVGSAGLSVGGYWFRDEGSDIIRMTPP